MCWSVDAGHGSEAARLRRELVAYLRRFGRAEADFCAAELILGELLSNAGRYTPGPVCVAIDWNDVFPRVTVCDGGRGFSWTPALPLTHAERGRGLYIVSALARDVEVEFDDAGCRVSAVLPVARAGVQPELNVCPQLRMPDAAGVCRHPRGRITERLSRGSVST